MRRFTRTLSRVVAICAALAAAACVHAAELPADAAPLKDGAVVKQVLNTKLSGENLLKPNAWTASDLGFTREGSTFVCDNGAAKGARRGVSQSVTLNQTRPEPIVASAWSKAEGVTGSADADYSLYLDLIYTDGTPLWGQIASFTPGTHDWERREVVVLPDKPVKQVSFHMLLRSHGGKASFRDPELRVIKTPEGACIFDGVPVVQRGTNREILISRSATWRREAISFTSRRRRLGLKLVRPCPMGPCGLLEERRRDNHGHHGQRPRGDAGFRVSQVAGGTPLAEIRDRASRWSQDASTSRRAASASAPVAGYPVIRLGS